MARKKVQGRDNAEKGRADSYTHHKMPSEQGKQNEKCVYDINKTQDSTKININGLI